MLLKSNETRDVGSVQAADDVVFRAGYASALEHLSVHLSNVNRMRAVQQRRDFEAAYAHPVTVGHLPTDDLCGRPARFQPAGYKGRE
jgi:hypothetical protein